MRQYRVLNVRKVEVDKPDRGWIMEVEIFQPGKNPGFLDRLFNGSLPVKERTWTREFYTVHGHVWLYANSGERVGYKHYSDGPGENTLQDLFGAWQYRKKMGLK